MDRVLAALVLGSVLVVEDAYAEKVFQHRLRVATALPFSNAQVDRIFAEMTEVLQSKNFDWDVPCRDVEVVREGSVIVHPALPLSGSADQLADALKQIAPAANVLIVAQIDCDGVFAAGCAPLSGDNMAVIDNGSRNGVLWSHERGHVLGRGHADNKNGGNGHPPETAMRVMYWYPEPATRAKSKQTCDAFRRSFPSIKVVNKPIAITDESVLSPQVAQTDATPEALRAVRPGPHGISAPPEQGESARAVEAARQVLAGPPSRDYVVAAIALGQSGDGSDVSRLAALVERRMAADEDLALWVQVKLTALRSLGFLANRLQSEAAVQTLERSARLDSSKDFIPSQYSREFSRSAMEALAIASTPRSRAFLDAAFPDRRNPSTTGSQALVASQADVEAPALSGVELKRLADLERLASEGGASAVIREGGRRPGQGLPQ